MFIKLWALQVNARMSLFNRKAIGILFLWFFLSFFSSVSFSLAWQNGFTATFPVGLWSPSLSRVEGRGFIETERAQTHTHGYTFGARIFFASESH